MGKFKDSLTAEALFRYYESLLNGRMACTLSLSDFETMKAAFDELKAREVPKAHWWIMQVPVLSTSHLTEATARYLTGHGTNIQFGSCAVYQEGFFLQTISKYDPMPEDLKAVLAWTEKRDYAWIRFDADGDCIDELPVYEWGDEEAAEVITMTEQADRYLLWTVGDVEPELEGPFHSDEARIEAARRLRSGEGREDGLYRLNVTFGSFVGVQPFLGREMEPALN